MLQLRDTCGYVDRASQQSYTDEVCAKIAASGCTQDDVFGLAAGATGIFKLDGRCQADVKHHVE
mgnify:FL=1